MGSQNSKDRISLEALLRVKRNETPSDDFWTSFESDLHRRRLTALVERRSVLDVLWNPTLRSMMVAVPVLLLSLTFFWVKTRDFQAPTAASDQPALELALNMPETAETPALRVQGMEELLGASGNLSSQFVMDAIEPEPESAVNFRKVLYTPALQLSSQSGASYVRDNFSASNYRVTTANLKVGRNF